MFPDAKHTFPDAEYTFTDAECMFTIGKHKMYRAKNSFMTPYPAVSQPWKYKTTANHPAKEKPLVSPLPAFPCKTVQF